MKSPRNPRSAYKWLYHHARRDGHSKTASRRVAMVKLNSQYNKRESGTYIAPPAWTPPPGWKYRWWLGDKRAIRTSVRKTPQEKARDIEKDRLFQRKVERSKLLMQKLMIAQKRGEDVSKYVEEARRNSAGDGDEKVEEEGCEEECDTPCAVRIRSPGANVFNFEACLNFKIPCLNKTDFETDFETDLQFHMELDPCVDAADCTEWDLPLPSIIASEGSRIEAYLNELP